MFSERIFFRFEPFLVDCTSSGFTFTVASYNVLCEDFILDNYPYCPSYALDFKYRSRRILDELIEANADIVCLQVLTLEIDFGLFFGLFLKPFSRKWIHIMSSGFLHLRRSVMAEPLSSALVINLTV